MKRFYKLLYHKFDLMLGTILTSIMSDSDLKNLIDTDSPYLSKKLKDCIANGSCQSMDTEGKFTSVFKKNYYFFFGSNPEIARVSNNPVHMKVNGHKRPSTFVPFCSYAPGRFKQNLTASFPACTSFKPVILDGQQCYQIDSAQLPAYSQKKCKNRTIFQNFKIAGKLVK